MEDHRVHLRPPVLLPVLVAVILGAAFVAGKHVEVKGVERFTITVSGDGEVSAVPDIASLNFGMRSSRNKTSEGAMEELSEVMEKVIEAVEKVGVEEKDIRTQYLNLNPVYDWNDGKRINQGFEAQQSLTVKVRDLDKVSDVLDAAVRAGANQAGGVSFTIDDPDELKAQARAEAIENAKEKAEKLADDLGLNLGKLVGFNEGGGYGGGYPMPYARMETMGAVMEDKAMAPPLPAGEQQVRVNVSLTYQLR